MYFKQLNHHSDNHFKLYILYFQDLMQIEQVKRKYFENISQKLSSKKKNKKTNLSGQVHIRLPLDSRIVSYLY